ncbi:AAA family ATPase [Cryptosporangium minutisporangium]|uniref:ATP-binding protein n=1 Tax=Cryptosporangium minutisporangium TaxID=113569 RepID=A0ABP6TB35_9ACTN
MPTPRPRAVLITGAPATGKSTVGRLVAGALHAALLDQDVVTGPLVAAVETLTGDAGLDGPVGRALRAARYEAIVAAAEDCLAVGTSAVLVAPFTTERSDADAYRVLAERFATVGATTTLVWLTAPMRVLLARMAARGADRDAGKLADPAGYFTPGVLAAPMVPHIAVNAGAPPESQLAEIVSSLA